MQLLNTTLQLYISYRYNSETVYTITMFIANYAGFMYLNHIRAQLLGDFS
jgi:hypothetical protein